MNSINITINFSEEDRQLLEGLMGSVSLLASVLGNTLPKEVQKQVIEEVTDPQHPADAPATHLEVVQSEPVVEEPKPEPAPAAAPIIISFAEFQKAVTLAVSKGPEAKKAAKAIVNKYAPSVSEIPEEKRAEVMAELAKI